MNKPRLSVKRVADLTTHPLYDEETHDLAKDLEDAREELKQMALESYRYKSSAMFDLGIAAIQKYGWGVSDE